MVVFSFFLIVHTLNCQQAVIKVIRRRISHNARVRKRRAVSSTAQTSLVSRFLRTIKTISVGKVTSDMELKGWGGWKRKCSDAMSHFFSLVIVKCGVCVTSTFPRFYRDSDWSSWVCERASQPATFSADHTVYTPLESSTPILSFGQVLKYSVSII